MKDKIFATENLYILHVSELIYTVPDGEVFFTPDTMYSRDYYTIAEKKKGTKYRDIFQLRTYKDEGLVGFGVIRDIDEAINIAELTNYEQPTMTKKDALLTLRDYISTLKEQEDIEISIPAKYTKNLKCDLKLKTGYQVN